MKNLFKKLKSKQHLPLLLFVVSGLLNEFLLRGLTIGNIFYWKSTVASIAILISLSLIPLLMDNRKRSKRLIVMSFLLALLYAANYLYHKHFDSFISISLIKQIKFLNDMDASISTILDLRVLLFFIPPILFAISSKKLENMDYSNTIKKERTIKNLVGPVAIGAICLVSVLTSLTSTDYSRLVKQWNRPYLVQNLGMLSYTLSDLVKTAVEPSTVIAELDDKVVKEYVDELIDENIASKKENIEITENYKDIFKGRDVYIIHYESAQTFAMELEFKDGNVTPFLNKMADEGLTFNNFYPQHSVGTSSDTEFTFNTSLYPINNGTVFISHFDREYISLQHLLKDEGYYSVSMHGNNGDFWNRNIMHQTLGYDHFFSKNEYIIDEEIGLGLSDMSFFNQSVDKLKKLKEDKEKVVATLITLTNHFPFDDVEKYGEFNVGHLEGTTLGNYLKSYHYADKALESFITSMDEDGLLDNAIIILYGDHHAQIPMSDYELLYNYNPLTKDYYTIEDEEYISIDGISSQKLRRTPFIIWSKDGALDMEIDTSMGMVDALPTIGNMLGIFNEYQLGNDIMNTNENLVIFPDGSWIDDKNYFSASLTSYYDYSNNIVPEDYSLLNKTKMAEEKLALSNEIISGIEIKSRREHKTSFPR